MYVHVLIALCYHVFGTKLTCCITVCRVVRYTNAVYMSCSVICINLNSSKMVSMIASYCYVFSFDMVHFGHANALRQVFFNC